MRRKRPQRGFTLIEMMVVVIIIGILSAIVISVKSGTYGANTQNTATSLSTLFNNCKMRAVATRRWHRCVVTPTTFTMNQWSATGLNTPAGACTPPSTNCYQLITQTTLDKNIFISNASTTRYPTAGVASAATTAANAGLVFNMDFKPDGSSSTGGTIFVTDKQGNKPWRILVYPATGGSYARAGW